MKGMRTVGGELRVWLDLNITTCLGLRINYALTYRETVAQDSTWKFKVYFKLHFLDWTALPNNTYIQVSADTNY